MFNQAEKYFNQKEIENLFFHLTLLLSLIKWCISNFELQTASTNSQSFEKSLQMKLMYCKSSKMSVPFKMSTHNLRLINVMNFLLF